MNSLPKPEIRAPNMTNEGRGRADLDHPVVTFRAYDRATGAAIVCDDRTFDGELHSLEPVAPVEGA